jgi:hypothetical protein
MLNTACPDRWFLELAWRSLCTPFRGEWHELKPLQRDQFEWERQAAPYLAALVAYRRHLRNCQKCRMAIYGGNHE